MFMFFMYFIYISQKILLKTDQMIRELTNQPSQVCVCNILILSIFMASYYNVNATSFKNKIPFFFNMNNKRT